MCDEKAYRQPAERLVGTLGEANPLLEPRCLHRVDEVLGFECKVALEGEDQRRALETLDCAHLVGVRYKRLVCRAHVLGADRVDAKYLCGDTRDAWSIFVSSCWDRR